METKTIKTQQLSNGLFLTILDASKKIAGDRWYICLIAHIEVPVQDALATLPPDQQEILPDTDPKRYVDILGETITFEKKLERNFVSDREKQGIQSDLLSAFLKDSVTYLASPNFAWRFVIKEYQTQMKHHAMR